MMKIDGKVEIRCCCISADDIWTIFPPPAGARCAAAREQSVGLFDVDQQGRPVCVIDQFVSKGFPRRHSGLSSFRCRGKACFVPFRGKFLLLINNLTIAFLTPHPDLRRGLMRQRGCFLRL